jgi:hypothetical protein
MAHRELIRKEKSEPNGRLMAEAKVMQAGYPSAAW